MTRKVEVSHKTIVFAAVFLVFLWFLFLIRDIILQVFVALLIMTVLNPVVDKITKLKVPRILAIILVYITLLGVLGGVIALMISPLIEQTNNFAVSLPRYLEQLNTPSIISQEVTRELTSQLGTIPGQVIKFGVSVFSNIISLLTVFIFGFYLLITRDKLGKILTDFFGEKRSEAIVSVMNKLEVRLGSWAGGQLLLMSIIGVSTYLGLTILGVPFALPLALLAAMLEIVPNLGPILAAIPAIIVGLGTPPFPLTGIAVAVMAFLIQQLENYFLVPQVMKKSVGLNPMVTLLAIIVGFRLAGVAGAVLSIPIVIVLQVLSKELIFNK